jgi:hypothetical protein
MRRECKQIESGRPTLGPYEESAALEIDLRK